MPSGAWCCLCICGGSPVWWWVWWCSGVWCQLRCMPSLQATELSTFTLQSKLLLFPSEIRWSGMAVPPAFFMEGGKLLCPYLHQTQVNNMMATNTLLELTNWNSGQCFLIDTGVEVTMVLCHLHLFPLILFLHLHLHLLQILSAQFSMPLMDQWSSASDAIVSSFNLDLTSSHQSLSCSQVKMTYLDAWHLSLVSVGAQHHWIFGTALSEQERHMYRKILIDLASTLDPTTFLGPVHSSQIISAKLYLDGYSYATILSSLSAVSFFHKAHCWDKPTTSFISKALARMCALWNQPKLMRAHITPKILVHLVQALDKMPLYKNNKFFTRTTSFIAKNSKHGQQWDHMGGYIQQSPRDNEPSRTLIMVVP